MRFAGRNIVLAAHYRVRRSLIKNFPVAKRFEFRLTSTKTLGLPSSNFSTPAAGAITTACGRSARDAVRAAAFLLIRLSLDSRRKILPPRESGPIALAHKVNNAGRYASDRHRHGPVLPHPREPRRIFIQLQLAGAGRAIADVICCDSAAFGTLFRHTVLPPNRKISPGADSANPSRVLARYASPISRGIVKVRDVPVLVRINSSSY